MDNKAVEVRLTKRRRGSGQWYQTVLWESGGPGQEPRQPGSLYLLLHDLMAPSRALAEVFPAARPQRCWVHKSRNVTNCLPKSAQPGATKAMQEIYNAEDRGHAEKAIEVFAKTYAAKFPEAVAKITKDRDELLAFYDFPAEHWIHLRTTNPIESTFSTVKLRTKVTRGAGSLRRPSRWCSS